MKYNFQTFSDDESGINHPFFLVESNHHNDYGVITIRPVWLKNEKIRFYHHSCEATLRDFEISCQWNLTPQIDESFNLPYAFRVGYTGGFGINHIDTAEEKIKFLKKIQSGMKKIADKFGSPESFEDFLVRISLCMSINEFITRGNGDGITRVFNAQDVKHYIKNLYNN